MVLRIGHRFFRIQELPLTFVLPLERSGLTGLSSRIRRIRRLKLLSEKLESGSADTSLSNLGSHGGSAFESGGITVERSST